MISKAASTKHTVDSQAIIQTIVDHLNHQYNQHYDYNRGKLKIALSKQTVNANLPESWKLDLKWDSYPHTTISEGRLIPKITSENEVIYDWQYEQHTVSDLSPTEDILDLPLPEGVDAFYYCCKTLTDYLNDNGEVGSRTQIQMAKNRHECPFYPFCGHHPNIFQ